jgi:putative membrane protein
MGILLGMFSGLVPGLHPNTISQVVAGAGFLGQGPEMAFLIISLAASAVVFESLRAIFLFVPDSTAVLTLLPGHRMLMEGRGFEAMRICAISFLASTAFAFILLPVSIAVFPVAYAAIAPNTPILLAVVALALLITERAPHKIAKATICFSLAGVLGVVVLGSPLLHEPLFPSFAGLFAISGIAFSMAKNEKIPMQKQPVALQLSTFLPVIFIGTILGGLADLLPGLSSAAQIAVLASIFTYLNSELFIALASSISSSHAIFALSALLTTGKARAGTIAIASAFIPNLSAEWVLALSAAALVATGISVALLMPLARRALPILQTLDSKNLNLLVLAYVIGLVFISEGAPGLAVATVASTIGILPPLLGVRRTHLMGFIMLPSILWPFI